jgi:hypothetical protein
MSSFLEHFEREFRSAFATAMDAYDPKIADANSERAKEVREGAIAFYSWMLDHIDSITETATAAAVTDTIMDSSAASSRSSSAASSAAASSAAASSRSSSGATSSRSLSGSTTPGNWSGGNRRKTLKKRKTRR